MRAIRRIRKEFRARKLSKLFHKYRQFTMVPEMQFVANLEICLELAPAAGCIVECGVWRGGMSAAMAEVLPGRRHLLFDSFEGLPPAREIDGAAALRYQENKQSPIYFDNCRAESTFSETAMSMSPAKDFQLVRGWFAKTLPAFVSPEPVAILRLDSDWYDSTMDCLTYIYPQMASGGLILIDDYYTWDGCSRAVHDYLSRHKLTDRVRESRGVCFLVKDERTPERTGDTTPGHDESAARAVPATT